MKKKLKQTIVAAHKKNLESLIKAAKNDQLGLMQVYDSETKKIKAAVCTRYFDGKDYHFTPFALMMNGNPFEQVYPPANQPGEEGAFYKPDGSLHVPTETELDGFLLFGGV